MSNGVLPHEVDAVVIGSGALGASTAFHLAKAGLKIALVDKAALASQTSPRAAGLSGQLRSDDRMTMIAARAVKKIETFSEDTGEPLIFYQPGSLKVARRLEDAAQIHRRGGAWPGARAPSQSADARAGERADAFLARRGRQGGHAYAQ